MKVQWNKIVPLAALGLACCFVSTSFAADLPKRKAGLWEVHVRGAGMPDMGAMQQCIDEKTDDLMMQQAQQQQNQCKVIDVQEAKNRFVVRSECKFEGMTATSVANFEGSFDSAYKGTIKTQYNPPLNGMSELTMTQEARWLGPCKPGQKPGDVIMPKMDMGMDAEGMKEMEKKVEEMMKDPKLQDLLKPQK